MWPEPVEFLGGGLALRASPCFRRGTWQTTWHHVDAMWLKRHHGPFSYDLLRLTYLLAYLLTFLLTSLFACLLVCLTFYWTSILATALSALPSLIEDCIHLASRLHRRSNSEPSH